MITTILLTIFNAFGVMIFLMGLQGLIFFPLTLVYEIWKKRALSKIAPFAGRVSILVPVYNEERTIRTTVDSILKSDYPSIELIVINDGSTDHSEEKIRDFIDSRKIAYIKKRNGGKASALNRGTAAATGDIVIFTDADSFFLPQTVRRISRWFGNPSIDAVCGNDAPLHPDTALQKLLAITTHIGTGFVRRALSVIGCLPIITGNLGAIRTSVLREINGFREIWGEDLEITFRLHKHGKRIIFDPDAKVLAECPATAKALWKQRVRWMRSYIKTVFLHGDLFMKSEFKPFSFYLPINFANMTIVPLLQLALLAIMPYVYTSGYFSFVSTLDVLTYLGLTFFFGVAVYSIVLDGDFHDLAYLPYGLLILPFSYFYNAVALFSWWREARGAEEIWEKIERRKIVHIGAREVRGWRVVVAGMLLVVVSSAATYWYATSARWDEQLTNMRQGLQQTLRPPFSLALSTHFDAWADWEKALRNVLNRPKIGMSDVIGVGAGRPEWVYFRWKGNTDAWANHQKGEPDDLLGKATDVFHTTGFKVAAIIDLYAPKYIKKNREAAAVRFDGEKSDMQVSLTELVEGQYGKMVLDMIGYVSRHYPVEIINLTEMSYHSFSFSNSDLRSYETFSGKRGWPLDAKGNIDIDDPTVWEWKSVQMERFIKQVAGIVHSQRKELYIDVPVSWTDFSRHGRQAGLDYRRVLNHADKIIVWNYFYLGNAQPEISRELSEHMVRHFPISSFYISIGLWGTDEHVDPEAFARAIDSTLKGGATQIWVTPNDLITKKHWNKLLPYWQVDQAGS
jgi:cellulose synthase/poly-beta-1,6-N-acetylglucosamine synthase-like glycosyltransferase